MIIVFFCIIAVAIASPDQKLVEHGMNPVTVQDIRQELQQHCPSTEIFHISVPARSLVIPNLNLTWVTSIDNEYHREQRRFWFGRMALETCISGIHVGFDTIPKPPHHQGNDVRQLYITSTSTVPSHKHIGIYVPALDAMIETSTDPLHVQILSDHALVGMTYVPFGTSVRFKFHHNYYNLVTPHIYVYKAVHHTFGLSPLVWVLITASVMATLIGLITMCKIHMDS